MWIRKPQRTLKVNNRSIIPWAVLLAALAFIAFAPNKIPALLEKKMHAAIESTFNQSDFELRRIEISDLVKETSHLKLKQDDHVFGIHAPDGSTLGFVFLGKAPSMKNIFDYLVILEPSLEIKKAKVLIYREDYGRQIGSQRWLKQFIGKRSGEKLQYGEHVDAISGATISAKSMTEAVNRVLGSMNILRTEKII